MNSNNPNKPATARLSSPKGTGRDIPTLVQQDIELRAKEGEEKYGERLTAFNGRKALVDAYQEVLDLSQYLRQEIEEDNEKNKALWKCYDILKEVVRSSRDSADKNYNAIISRRKADEAMYMLIAIIRNLQKQEGNNE